MDEEQRRSERGVISEVAPRHPSWRQHNTHSIKNQALFFLADKVGQIIGRRRKRSDSGSFERRGKKPRVADASGCHHRQDSGLRQAKCRAGGEAALSCAKNPPNERDSLFGRRVARGWTGLTGRRSNRMVVRGDDGVMSQRIATLS